MQVWQRSHEFVLEIYKLTKRFPKEEKYGVVSQLRRAAASVPTNIAEGVKKGTRKDYARFVNMAETSLEEAKYLILLSRDLDYISSSNYESLLSYSDEIGRMLNGLYKRLKI